MRCNGVVCRIQAQVDGTKYEVGAIKASEADRLTAWTNYDLREWEGKLVDGDPLAARALLALMAFRNGQQVRINDIEIDDVDSIDADLVDPQGRKVTVKIEASGKPVLVKGEPVFLFDGEPLDPPSPLVKERPAD